MTDFDSSGSTFAGASCAEDMHRIIQFVLRMLSDRRWRVNVPRFMCDVDLMRAYADMTENFGEDAVGALPKLTLHGTFGPSSKREECMILFRSKTVKMMEARSIVDQYCVSDDQSSDDDNGDDDEDEDDDKDNIQKKTQSKNIWLLIVQPSSSTGLAEQFLKKHFKNVQTNVTFDFCRSDLMRNIIVPHHAAVGATRRRKILATLGANKLQRIFLTDPVVVYHGWKQGTIVRIRQLQDVGQMDNFRIVVSPDKDKST